MCYTIYDYVICHYLILYHGMLYNKLLRYVLLGYMIVCYAIIWCCGWVRIRAVSTRRARELRRWGLALRAFKADLAAFIIIIISSSSSSSSTIIFINTITVITIIIIMSSSSSSSSSNNTYRYTLLYIINYDLYYEWLLLLIGIVAFIDHPSRATSIVSSHRMRRASGSSDWTRATWRLWLRTTSSFRGWKMALNWGAHRPRCSFVVQTDAGNATISCGSSD